MKGNKKMEDIKKAIKVEKSVEQKLRNY